MLKYYIKNRYRQTTSTITLVFLITICCEKVMFSQDSTLVIPLWEHGAPGFEDRKNEPEQAKDWWVKNIHLPSVTAYFPKNGISNGPAVVICPGGGHRALVYNSEGRDAAQYFNTLGVTAFVVKYRLFREENSPYKEEHTRQDGIRAMRT